MPDASGVGYIMDYITQKRASLQQNNDSLTTLGNNQPGQQLANQQSATASANANASAANSPLSQLGSGYIGEMISKNGAQIISNVDTIVGNKINGPIADAQSLVFNTIAAALTAQNDMIMYFLQQVAKQGVIALANKDAILVQLQAKLVALYNALQLLVSGSPVYNEYLLQLRESLTLILGARNDLVNVVNTLSATQRWLGTTFQAANASLVQAEALMQPPAPNAPVSYNHPSLLSGVGVSPPNNQIQLVLAIPQLVQECLAAASGYFAATAEANLIILGFLQGYSQLTQVSSSLVSNYSTSTLSNIINKLDPLISDMANQLNGAPTQTAFPITGFSPNPIKVSASALNWLLQLKTIVSYMTFVPGPTLNAIQTSNQALATYDAAVVLITSKNSVSAQGATLTATAGQESITDLESQLTTYCLAALQSIVSASVASNIQSLGRTLQARCNLSLTQDQQISSALSTFANTNLGAQSTLNAAGSAITKLMSSMGLDRAANLLQTGQFASFLGLNTKTATYAGAALMGIGILKQCVGTQQDQQQLVQAEQLLKQENKSKQLFAQRGATAGIANQKAVNTAQDKQLVAMQNQVSKAATKCGLTGFSTPNLLASLGGAIGASAFGGPTLSAALTKLGKGII